VAAILGLLAAVVVLSLNGKSAVDITATLAALIPLAGALLAGLEKIADTQAETKDQTATLATISEQTNGKLDQRITDAVDSAIRARFGPAQQLHPDVEQPGAA
jgi:hypothetical protein